MLETTQTSTAALPEVTSFFDQETNTVSHVVADPDTGICAVIDPVIAFEPASCRTDTTPADEIVRYVRSQGLECAWVIDTHVHADHLSAMDYVSTLLGGRTAIGNQIPLVQATFAQLFGEDATFKTDGSQFDYLFDDGERYRIGNLDAIAIATPGHTPACMSHLIGDALFVGDTLFMPDYGTARCDFPGGSAHQLFHSVQALYALDEQTRVFLCHDYKVPGRDEYAWRTTIGEQKLANIHINADTEADTFVALRHARDDTLAVPRLMLPAVQVNMRAGRLPMPADNGINYLKLPVNQL